MGAPIALFRRPALAPQSPLLVTLAVFLPLATAALIVLLLVSGIDSSPGSSLLSKLAYLTVDTKALLLPELSLGAPDSYTVHLLTLCGHTSTSASCAPPQLGFFFDPRVDLQLDINLVAAGQYSPSLLAAIRTYRFLSPYIAVAHIGSAALLGLCGAAAAIAIALVAVLPDVLVLLFMLLCGAGFSLSLSAAVAEAAVFPPLVSSINSDHGTLDLLFASPGQLSVISMFAAILSCLSMLVMTALWRASLRRHTLAHSLYRAQSPQCVRRARHGVAKGSDTSALPMSALHSAMNRPPIWDSREKHGFVQFHPQPRLAAIVEVDVDLEQPVYGPGSVVPSTIAIV